MGLLLLRVLRSGSGKINKVASLIVYAAKYLILHSHGVKLILSY
jgi:hypothetical protein